MVNENNIGSVEVLKVATEKCQWDTKDHRLKKTEARDGYRARSQRTLVAAPLCLINFSATLTSKSSVPMSSISSSFFTTSCVSWNSESLGEEEVRAGREKQTISQEWKNFASNLKITNDKR
ncbi:hypothetical protein T265_06166 [Opisthorchis viverrini]|uniref:Uncharacterized protein n=1 Tax=Opisthorchis viverrini TaxID=6198 RepID=A0A075AEA4_OPIVI|nr:hypothetical protein T265_06166 [Opisthorchis viverrini]KER26589.1 hypothetical protein T265_06166 [Opisthorchis viverrini]